jgi:hypothetical protein
MGAVSFADQVYGYRPDFGGGPVPDDTQQEARQILGVPEQGEMSLGNGGRVLVTFNDNRLTGSGDDTPDLYIFEVGVPETVHVAISRTYFRGPWHNVGTATGYASAIDIDQFGFSTDDQFRFVRIIDDGNSGSEDPFTAGADLVAVGARSTVVMNNDVAIVYHIQAYVGGRSELMIRGSTLQWHHLKGTAPGLERQFWNPGSEANAPTLIESFASNLTASAGPVISWVPTGWPARLGNGTHPESYSSVFDGLTPVLPLARGCMRVEKLWGDGKVSVVQHPDASNDFTAVVRFDDLGMKRPHGYSGALHGALNTHHGSGFYAIKLVRKAGTPEC